MGAICGKGGRIMAFDINVFRSQVLGSTGFLQTNKYDVNVVPGALVPNAGDTQDMMFRCVNATLPGVGIRTSDNNRHGLGIIEKMPYSGAYTDVTLSFICDKGGSVYNFWYGWINTIFAVNGEETGHTISGNYYYTANYKDDYAGEIDVIVYNNQGDPSLTYQLLKAFPVSINDSPLGWGDNNNLLKLTTTITFREWNLTSLSA